MWPGMFNQEEPFQTFDGAIKACEQSLKFLQVDEIDLYLIHNPFAKENRIDYWIGVGTATWTISIIATIIGYISADYLNKDIIIGLAIVNPIYFFCMMIGAMKNIAISISVILGTTLGPVIYLFSTEWSLLFAGLIAGTVAYLFGEKDGK